MEVSSLRFKTVLYLILLASLAVQFLLLSPLEVSLFDDSAVKIASFMFLPHGVKVICAAFAGRSAFVPIFFAHVTTDFFLDKSFVDASFSGIVGVLSVAVPLIIFNYLSERPLLERPATDRLKTIYFFRFILAYGLISSLINSLLRSSWHIASGLDVVNSIALRFIVGDMLGTLFALLVLLALKNTLLALGKRIVGS